MRLSILLAALFSLNTFAGVKTATYTGNTDVNTGLLTLSVKVPGTFGSIDPTSSSWVGRQLLKMGLFFESRAAGDRITEMYVSDVDGVIPAPYRAAFPSYPILKNLEDGAAPADNQGITFPPGGGPFQIDFPNSGAAKLASGIYLVVTFKKASPSVDAATINIAWDDGT